MSSLSFSKKIGILLKTSGLIAGLTLLTMLPQAAFAEDTAIEKADVIVVGGGLAGLSAARTLIAGGYSVILLEANDRVGGRTWTKKTSDGGWVDMGGQWIGPGMNSILALAEELGVKTFPSHYSGKNIFIYDGKRAEYSADVEAAAFPLPDADIAEYRSVLKIIDTLAAEVPVDAPWEAPHAKEWDSQTVATWMKDNMKTPGAQFLLRVFLHGYFASEPSDVSFLHFLFYIQSGGGFHKLHASGIALRFLEGSQQISEKVAQQMGNRVKLNSPVVEIDQTGKTIIVSTKNGQYIAKQVIVAMSPPLASRISYQPILPSNRDQFTQRAPIGSTIKVHAVYSKAFWRKTGYSGMVISGDDDVSLVVDNSPPSGVPGILGGFFEGQESREWAGRTEDDIKKKVLESFVKFYGPDAATPTAFYIADWGNQPWARGCFTSVFPPGVWTGFKGSRSTPVGRIHWAGTETATQWYAYMDGAVSSGKRAADEVMKELKANISGENK